MLILRLYGNQTANEGEFCGDAEGVAKLVEKHIHQSTANERFDGSPLSGRSGQTSSSRGFCRLMYKPTPKSYTKELHHRMPTDQLISVRPEKILDLIFEFFPLDEKSLPIGRSGIIQLKPGHQ